METKDTRIEPTTTLHEGAQTETAETVEEAQRKAVESVLDAGNMAVDSVKKALIEAVAGVQTMLEMAVKGIERSQNPSPIQAEMSASKDENEEVRPHEVELNDAEPINNEEFDEPLLMCACEMADIAPMDESEDVMEDARLAHEDRACYASIACDFEARIPRPSEMMGFISTQQKDYQAVTKSTEEHSIGEKPVDTALRDKKELIKYIQQECRIADESLTLPKEEEAPTPDTSIELLKEQVMSLNAELRTTFLEKIVLEDRNMHLEEELSSLKEKGAYIYKYPHAALTTDCVVFGFDGKELHILLVERGGDPYKGMWALPGGFMRIDETVEQCARRELIEETNWKGEIFLEQFHVYSAVKRDSRERVVTVAFLALVGKGSWSPEGGDDASDAKWWKLDDLPALAFDHEEIVRDARVFLKERMRTKPLAFELLGEKFKMSELQKLFETVLETEYDRRNFARKMISSGYLETTDEEEMTGARPAQLFSFKAEEYERNAAAGGRNPFDI